MNKRTIVTACLLAVFALVLVDNASALTKKQKEAIQKEAQATEQAGDTAIRAEKFSEAVTHYQKAVELYESIGTKPNEVRSSQGSLADRLRAAQQGVQKQQQQEQLAREATDTTPNSGDDFEIRNAQGGVAITGYTGKRRYVIIPETIEGLKVTSIAGSAFSGKNILSVKIPNTVTTIGSRAFKENELVSVEIPNTVTSIDYEAFSKNNISSLVIPNSVTKIATGAFSYNQISSLKIPESITVIPDSAFSNNKIRSLEIPNWVTKIDVSAFRENGMETLILGNKVAVIETSAFRENKLKAVVFPASLRKLGEGAFYDNELEAVVIPNGVTHIGRGCFDGENNKIKSVTIPPSLSGIKRWSGFYDMPEEFFGEAFPSGITTITLPANVEEYIIQQNFENVLDFYREQGKKAGTYTWTGRIWTVK